MSARWLMDGSGWSFNTGRDVGVWQQQKRWGQLMQFALSKHCFFILNTDENTCEVTSCLALSFNYQLWNVSDLCTFLLLEVKNSKRHVKMLKKLNLAAFLLLWTIFCLKLFNILSNRYTFSTQVSRWPKGCLTSLETPQLLEENHR